MAEAPAWLVLARGAFRRCPRCGRGRLFRGWMTPVERCERCGEPPLADQGDPWAFLIVLDRVFVLALIAVIYFKLWPRTGWGLAALLGGLLAAFVLTTPQRYGICLALVHLVRRRWG